MPTAFVKFSRGLTSVYNNLRLKDPNTLYLIYDSADAPEGRLYLGDKLISGVTSASNISLNDLSNVSINEPLEDGMLLQYNSSTSGGTPYWQATTVRDVLNGYEASGGGSYVSIVEQLEDLATPHEKDIAVIGNDVYIYDGTEWKQLTNTDLENRVSALEDAISNIYTKEEIQQYINGLSHLKYEVVNSLEDIDLSDPASATTVFLIPKSSSEDNNGYDEYFIINNHLEKLGDWGVDLSGYVQTNDDRLLTQEQKNKLNTITVTPVGEFKFSGIINAAQVTDLQQYISDHQFIKSVQAGVFNVDSNGKLELISIPVEALNLDLSNFVTRAEVGNLSDLTDRVSEDSTIVDEINYIKENLSWKDILIEE